MEKISEISKLLTSALCEQNGLIALTEAGDFFFFAHTYKHTHTFVQRVVMLALGPLTSGKCPPVK